MQHDERILLAVALDKKYLASVVKHKKTMSERGKALLNNIEEYHRTHEEWDIELFSAMYRAGNMNKDAEQIESMLSVVAKAEAYLEEEDCASLLDRYHNYDIADKAQTLLMSGLNDDTLQINDVITEVKSLLEDTAAVHTAGLEQDLSQGTVAELMDQAFHPGLQWRLPELNARIGDLRLDQHCNFAARPGTGKTSFIADTATWMARQLPPDASVVWFGNEEPGSTLRRRAFVSAIGRPLTAQDNAVLLQKEYEQAVQGEFDNRLIICRPEKLSDKYVVEALEFLHKKGRKPGLIIIDQLRLINGFDNRRDPLMSIYNWGRSLPALYGCPLISVHQLADKRGQMNLMGMMSGLSSSDLHGSKIEVPGACDLMLAMGSPEEPEKDMQRCINVTKTKELSGPMLDPIKAKQDLPVLLIPAIGRYKAHIPEYEVRKE